MIPINKPQEIPEKLRTDGKKKRQSHCSSYSRNPEKYQRGEQKFTFDSNIYGHQEVKKALIDAQYGKCCFCERKIGQDGDVEHFRPKGAFRQEAGKPLEYPGYYWLAYDWDNLYLACSACNQRHKQNLFPLLNPDNRAKNHKINLHQEKPFFIDPGKDNPEEFIQFRGEIAVGIDSTNRGKATIESLSLNRPNLQEVRRDKLKLLQTLFNLLKTVDQNLNHVELMEELNRAKVLIEES
ncbi:MAG: retron system putative HNH endonuclease, partial [Microcystaceae cyanobacterium]